MKALVMGALLALGISVGGATVSANVFDDLRNTAPRSDFISEESGSVMEHHTTQHSLGRCGPMCCPKEATGR